jgi:hypothetical protein
MKGIRKHFDSVSLAVIIITFLLFVVALVLKGFVHDLLLEAGVLLVSIKLILMSYKNGVAGDELAVRLDRIESTLERIERRGDGGEGASSPGAPGKRSGDLPRRG